MVADTVYDKRSIVMLIAASFQGLSLLLLHHLQAGSSSVSMPWLLAGYSFVITAPTLLMLSLDHTHIRRVLVLTLAFSVTTSLLSFYIGHQLPAPAMPSQPLIISILVLTLLVASFKALMYIQSFSDDGPLINHHPNSSNLNYSRLFLLSWRNLIILSLALLFTLAFDGILFLCGSLFKAVEIRLVMDVITSENFYYPVLAVINGIGILIFQKQVGVIDTITRIQQALMKLLLVLLVLVSSTFLFVLLFTGLSSLWENGGSGLIFAMQALMLFFLNAVYQDDPDTRPYSLWIHRFIYSGIAILPIYSVVSLYGLALRIEQYGWSVLRCWAFLLWAVLAGFSLQYLIAILRQRDRWMHSVSRINVRMGLVVLALMLLVNSPLLDFRKITVSNQIARMESGGHTLANQALENQALEDFDLQPFARSLGNPGYDALEEIKTKYGESHPELARRVNEIINRDHRGDEPMTQQQRLSAITYLDDAPDDLNNAIYEFSKDSSWQFLTANGQWLLRVDMDNAAPDEYILVVRQPNAAKLTLFYKEDNRWRHRDYHNHQGRHLSSIENKALFRALRNRDYESAEPRWRALRIGEETFNAW